MRWLIDGMNLIGSRPDRWWNDPDRAMRGMAEMLDEYARRTGDEVTVVFDRQPAALEPPSVVRVVVSRWKGRNAADHEIEIMVGNDDDPRTLLVVTSDRWLAKRVRSFGATTVSSGSFRRSLDEALE